MTINNKDEKEQILLTGCAGFVGFHTARALLERGDIIVGVDNFNDYYDPKLKAARARILNKYPKFRLYRGGIENRRLMNRVFKENRIEKVCHLAAQAGVRYSLINSYLYIRSNIVGFANIIGAARQNKIENFVYASSSSVYGNNKKIPFSVEDPVNQPISLYAATKRADELMAYTYHHLYGLNCTGLRLFTVYGPWGRPDMAYFTFTRDILAGKTIKVFNHGRMKRDFTYIDDIVSGIVASIDKPMPYEIFNLGNNRPITLEMMINSIEKALGKKAKKKYLPMQPGDVSSTYADISKSRKVLNFQPKTVFGEGIIKFIEWYKEYYRVK